MSTNLRVPLNYTEDVKRAVHELPCVKRATMHPGLLVPAYYRRMKRGEKFIFSTPQMLIQSQPTLAPVLGTYRLRVEWYFNSDANHYGWIDNNSRLTTDEVLSRRHHTFSPNLYGCSELNDYGFKNFPSTNPLSENNITSYRDLLTTFGNGRGSLLDFCGVTPGYIPNGYSSGSNIYGNIFNLDMILTYLNIIRCYHVNQQFPSVPYVARPLIQEKHVNNVSTFNVFNTFDVEDLDNLFMFLRYCDNGVHFPTFVYNGEIPRPLNLYRDVFDVNGYDGDELDVILNHDVPLKYRKAVAKFMNYLRCVSFENSGLFCTEYAPDLYRNLLNKDADLLRSIVQITTGTNAQGQQVQGIAITEFRYANRLQEIYERIQPFGGKDSTISRTRWGITSNREYDIPELICVQTEYIDTNAITSNNSGTAVAEGIENVPGDLSGNVNTRKYNSGKQKFTANTSGTLMAIVSILPLVDYSENIEHHLLQNNFEDEFSPQMAQRGFESVPQSDFIALPTFEYDSEFDGDVQIVHLNLKNEMDNVVGKQVAWLHDIAITHRTHGEFARFGELENWCLTRNYMKLVYPINPTGAGIPLEPPFAEARGEVIISPYANPLDWQYPFVSTSVKDPNWYIQCVFDVKDVSPVGYRFMPTLGR